MQSIAYVGMDVHKNSITVAVLPRDAQDVEDPKVIHNTEDAVRKHFRKLQRQYALRCCYEAGGCGYVLQRWLAAMDVPCDVIAPSKTPVRAGDRVKTDPRDARKLARLYRAGELTVVHAPTAQEEAVRALVRCRETIRREVTSARHYVLKFLNARGLNYREGKNWTTGHWAYLRALKLEGADEIVFREYLALLEYTMGRLAELDQKVAEMAQSEEYRELVGRLCCLRGIATHTAMVIVAETIDFKRFASPRDLMAYYGLVPSEASSGGKQRQGGITKTGSSRCRRVLVEAAWHYQHHPAVGKGLQKRQAGQPADVIAHSWKAQQRLNKKFSKIAYRKEKNKAVVATARELTGFIWAIATGRCGHQVA